MIYPKFLQMGVSRTQNLSETSKTSKNKQWRKSRNKMRRSKTRNYRRETKKLECDFMKVLTQLCPTYIQYSSFIFGAHLVLATRPEHWSMPFAQRVTREKSTFFLTLDIPIFFYRVSRSIHLYSIGLQLFNNNAIIGAKKIGRIFLD